MKSTIRLFLFLSLVIYFSCEEQGLFVNCPDCTTDEPLNTNLEVKLESGLNNTSTLITVYEGYLEDNVVYSSFHSSDTKTTIPVTINKKYTVTATYLRSGENYIAVDSATPRVRYSKEQCNDPCYFVYDRVVDLRLKYTK
jgi:hypothetical protein